MNIRQNLENFNPVSDADLKALVETHPRDKIIAALQALSLPLESLSKRSQGERRAIRDYLEPGLPMEPEDCSITPGLPHAKVKAEPSQRTRGLPIDPTKSDLAVMMAARGFRVFLCRPNDKPPLHDGWQSEATTDAATIRAWFKENPNANYGIAFTEGQGALDPDEKGGKHGLADLARLEAEHGALPVTLTVATTTGGQHHYFSGDLRGSNGKRSLGGAIDVKALGGYVVGPGSTIDGKAYRIIKDAPVVAAPAWLLDLAKVNLSPPLKRAEGVALDEPHEITKMKTYLANLVEQGQVAVSGQGGNNHTFKVACLVMDYVSDDIAYDLIAKIFNPACQPEWSERELRTILGNAAKHRQNDIGAKASKPAAEAFRDFDFSKAKDKTKTEEPKGAQTLSYQIASKTKTEKISWLWPERIPANELSIIGGDPDCGKSTLVYDLIAKITHGNAMPNEEGNVQQGAALVLTAEDSVKSVLVPRLKAAGADLNQVIILDAMVKVEGGNRLLDLAVDLDRIKATLAHLAKQKIIVRLVTIDPITAYLGAGVNSFKAADMRRLLTPLREWAEANKITVLIVTHLNKSGTSSNPLNRLTDSHALGALSRSAWLCAPERDDDGNETGRFLFMRAKGNLAKRSVKNLAYRFEGVDVALDDGSTYNHPRIAWDSIVETTAREAFDPDYGKSRTKQDTAAMFLKAALADGPVPVEKIKELAEARDLGWRTVETAKAKLSVISEPVGFGPGSHHAWRLRDIAQEIVAAEAARAAKEFGIDPEDPDYALLCPSETRH